MSNGGFSETFNNSEGFDHLPLEKVPERGESIEVIVGGFAGERTVQKVVGLGDKIWREIEPEQSGDLRFLMSFLWLGNGGDRST
jgi:hypothetical protein